MLLTSNVKSLGYRCGICDSMNFSVTLAKLAASSIFPESTRHLIRCLNRSREQMRPKVFLCERTVIWQGHCDIYTTYGHWSWCEFYYSTSPQRYSMHQAPNLSLYVHLATVQPVQFNTIPIPTDLALTLEACNFPFWRSVWTKYFKHHALHYNSCTVSFKWKPCMLATLSYMNDTQLWILNILYPILLTPWLAVWLTLHCAWMVH